MKHFKRFCLNSDLNWLHIFIVILSIFILGVQLGIKQGRIIEKEEMMYHYDYCISN